MISVRVLTGSDLDAVLPDVAALRIEVFRDWPYLYDGDLSYEQSYLQVYRDSAKSVLVGAFDGDRLVGASTGTPLIDHADDFAAAFEGRGYDLAQVFYCAESVLLPEYRGAGIGHRFFDLREAHAEMLGFVFVTFCGVMRSDDHPMKPKAYRPLDPFWRARGYVPLDGAVALFKWRDVGQDNETEKPLQVWIKPLGEPS